MKRINWQVILGFSLIALSAVLYLVHYAIFRDTHNIFFYLLLDIAFVPISVLLVTLIIHQLLNVREKRSRLNKLNMAIGVFFSKVGIKLLKSLAIFDANSEKIRNDLIIKDNWKNSDFFLLANKLKSYESKIDSQLGDLEDLRNFFVGKRDFLLRLLENQNLLEHETFTEMLWAVFHLAEELSYRADVKKLSKPDYAHLSGDMKRAQGYLLAEWISYMKHLKTRYPYLFSLAIRINPFDPTASVEIKET
jgi:hypothetical protein